MRKFYMWYEVAPDQVGSTEKFKVMVHRAGVDLFHVYVDKNYFRRFTVDTMPDKLKEHIAMIHSFDWSSLGKDFYVPPLQWHPSLPDYLTEIGWKTSPSEYCVIMDKDLLDILRGESVSQDTVTEDA